VIGAALFVNIATTLALALREGAPILLQLRYNLRSIPLVFVAIAWLVMRAPVARRARIGWTFAALAAVSGAVTAFAMVHPVDSRLAGSYALGERGFLAGLVLGRDEGSRPAPYGTGVSLRLDAEMADWISGHVHGKNAVLTDDAQTFGVMLADGHPERYFDRIDHGQGRWLRVVRKPVGRVEFVLVQSAASPTANSAFYDRIVAAYPGLGQGNPPPFMRLVHRNSEYALYAVTATPRR
jgi:hypothetical protein